VDLSELPDPSVPIRYPDFSIVDGPGFSENPSPDRVVQTDPRKATAEKGKREHEETVTGYVRLAEEALKQRGLG
jgi:hypothetical protein